MTMLNLFLSKKRFFNHQDSFRRQTVQMSTMRLCNFGFGFSEETHPRSHRRSACPVRSTSLELPWFISPQKYLYCSGFPLLWSLYVRTNVIINKLVIRLISSFCLLLDITWPSISWNIWILIMLSIIQFSGGHCNSSVIFEILCNWTSLYAVFLSAISRICD